MPHPGNADTAELAAISHQIVSGNKISTAFNQQVFAVVTVGVVALMSGHVAHIDIVNPCGHGQIPETRQGRDRGRGQPIQFVAGEKPQKVQWMVGTDIF